MYHRYLEVNKRRLPGGYHPSTAMPDLVLMSEGQVKRFVGLLDLSHLSAAACSSFCEPPPDRIVYF